MKRNWFFVIGLLLPIFLAAEQEIEVRLSTKQYLSPIYLGKVHAEDAQFSSEYASEVENILRFDLNHSGFSYLLSEDIEKEAHLASPDPVFWKVRDIPYALKANLISGALTLTIHDSKQQTLQVLSTPLSGIMAADRTKIHKLASVLMKELFGKEGIFHKKILYAKRTKNHDSDGPEWISEIWICDFDGKNARQMTHEKGYCVSPRFIAKKPGNFVYVSYKHGQSKIFLGSFENKTGNHFISLRGNQILPSLTMASDKLAFIGDAAGRPDLFVQYFDPKGALLGKPRQVFSFPRATQASPTFSPDGRKIAFVSDKDGPPRIYTLNLPSNKDLDMPEATLLTKKNRQNTSPCWSPDGTKLAYSAKTNDVRQIWIYDFASDEEWQLTFGNQNLENPVWASDSIHLIFNSEKEDNSELYIADIHQREMVKISEGEGQKRFPAWEY